jgi:hypothetical protein
MIQSADEIHGTCLPEEESTIHANRFSEAALPYLILGSYFDPT